MNPERSAMRNIDSNRERRIELSPLMHHAYEKATNEVLSNPDYAIQESEFTGGEHSVYDAHTVAADIELGNRRKKEYVEKQTPFEANSQRIADVFEAITLMESEQSNWLGNVTTIHTSRYDDYVNKVDLLAEWQTPESGSQLLALGVDVTFGTSKIGNKIAAIKEEIDRGKLGSIRYYKDSRGDFMGTRNNVPRTVIGISQPIVEQLAGLWMNGDKKSLGEHPIQRAITGQIAVQLNAVREYALARGNHAAAQAYEQPLAIIRKVRNEGSVTPIGTLIDDSVWQEILAQTKRQFRL